MITMKIYSTISEQLKAFNMAFLVDHEQINSSNSLNNDEKIKTLIISRKRHMKGKLQIIQKQKETRTCKKSNYSKKHNAQNCHMCRAGHVHSDQTIRWWENIRCSLGESKSFSWRSFHWPNIKHFEFQNGLWWQCSVTYWMKESLKITTPQN